MVPFDSPTSYVGKELCLPPTVASSAQQDYAWYATVLWAAALILITMRSLVFLPLPKWIRRVLVPQRCFSTFDFLCLDWFHKTRCPPTATTVSNDGVFVSTVSNAFDWRSIKEFLRVFSDRERQEMSLKEKDVQQWWSKQWPTCDLRLARHVLIWP